MIAPNFLETLTSLGRLYGRVELRFAGVWPCNGWKGRIFSSVSKRNCNGSILGKLKERDYDPFHYIAAMMDKEYNSGSK